ncbi:acetate--CoA ligase [Sphingomonas sp. S17]|uniref:Acetyl-coenzyme A synthetase n=8 Tax=Pseudomonadota TaxID=1224 RepID=A0A7T3ABS8_SPHPI|nr:MULTISPECIES: acetate--CoA ligase [Sphingomonas]EGI55537.1 acetate--CoA ligase [Sphingomonas sp. S17]MCM3680221.1 acetate--CoA ligase [Sphingomonas paucimobilis]MDG5970413.1 acetate--CoA ligase [Sphingomonas paucimobilis]QBE93201.1 acetate--CoA ligase [Sphingomonas paucimobilis]QPS15123.1 acetate--CoA ligase [Sphingomonas paucimobilis]
MTAHVHPVPDWADSASMDAEGYARAYDAAKRDPDGYWREQAQRLDWIVPFTTVKDTSFDEADFRIHWFADGQLNVAANCIDRHLATRADQVAILWEGDAPGTDRRITYRELHEQVSRLANALKGLGVAKGDQVTIYLPMIPEAAFAMLACARIGAIHSIVFGGFSPESLANRIIDCDSRIVITADGGCRGGKAVPLKANVDAALEHDGVAVDHVVVVRHSGTDVTMKEGRDQWYGDLVAAAAADCPPEPMGAEDPLFILYTSGSTGKPKGVLHTSGGYLLWASYTHQHVFDYREGEVFWCAADVGWVTGHSYVVYGALANGATTLMYEGVPNYPDHSRFWQIVDKYKVATFYAAPTALRALMREGDDWVTKTDRSSLRVLGSVGEPINPEAWEWFYRVVGEERCPIVDTWWQTETGGHMIAPIPGAVPLKAGSATKPLPGVLPQIVDAEGKVLDGAVEGNLVIADSWPGQMRTVWGDHERFFQTYFTTYPGKYFTGDGCRRDEDGYYWITGRVDDVINVSGHRMGTAEVESALVAHAKVAEAAVVGMPHDVKGQGIYAFVTLNAGVEDDEALRAELVQWVRREIGPIATPDALQFAPALPKTRSGKIMRRILRKIAENQVDALGDTSTLADPAVVDHLVANRIEPGKKAAA